MVISLNVGSVIVKRWMKVSDGRPKNLDETKLVWLTSKQKKKLERIAEKRRISSSALIRNYIDEDEM